MLLSEAWNSYKSANDTTPEKQRKKKKHYALNRWKCNLKKKKKKYPGNNTDILNLKLVGKRNLYPSCVLDKKNLAFNIYIFTFT